MEKKRLNDRVLRRINFFKHLMSESSPKLSFDTLNNLKKLYFIDFCILVTDYAIVF